MKEIKNSKKSIIKKIFIKICRLLGYEIIDQSNFFIPTLNKSLNDKISIKGKKSINLPLGEVRITRKVKSLDVIIRTCSSVNMLTQNKDRIFQKEKIEYTLRSINSILKSIKYAKKSMDELLFKIYIVDHNSGQENLNKIKNIIEKYSIQFKIYNLNLKDFEEKIKKTNQKNEKVTSNQISNMSNIYKSLQLSKENSSDLIYFVEDDYIHEESAISEMILVYERISSLTNKELIVCPTDYPYLYTKAENTQVYLGEKYHWRKIDETLCTFLTSKKIVENHWKKLISMCEFEHYPFESPLHKIYEEELCISPIPSLAIHCTNVNSIFGLSPNIDWKKLWEENKV